MSTEALTPGNPTVILIDCAIGFANIVRSHDVGNFDRTVQLLARTALEYNSGLVVTNGHPQKSSGPIHHVGMHYDSAATSANACVAASK